MAPDIGKIKSNISLMADQGATEEEIDIYVASEGTSAAELAAVPSPAPVEAPARPHNEVLQEMITGQKPLGEIEAFLRSTGNDPSGQMDAIAADMKFRKDNPNYTGARGAIDLPKANPAAKASTEVPSLNDGINASFLEGLIPNLSNNVRGVGGVLGNGIRTLVNGDEWDPAGAFQSQYDKATADDAAFEEAHPIIDNVSAASGFGAGFALPATKLLQGAKYGESALKSGVVNGAVTGAGYGALSGLLNPSGAGRLENGAYGAGGGTVLGAAAAPVIRGATGVAEWAGRVAPPIGRMASDIQATVARLRGQAPEIPLAERHAQRVIAGDMQGNKIATGMGTGDTPMTASTVTDEITRRTDQGMPAMPADLSDQLRRRTSWALQGQGPMATAARTRLAARQANQGSRVRQRVQEELGSAVDPIKAAEDIARKASDEATPNYQQAYAEGVVITPEIQAAMQAPVFKQGLKQAYENIQNRGGNPEELGMFMDEAGELTLGNAPSLEAMDQVIRTIRGDVKRDAFGKAMTDTKTGAEQAAAGNLDALLRGQNDAYDVAKSTFADDMAIKDAMARGGDVGKMSGHEINANIRNTPVHAQEAFMAGAGTATADKAVTVGQRPTADVSQAIRKDLGFSGAGMAAAPGDAVKIDAIEQMSGRPGMMSRLDDKLESEAQGYKTFNEAYGNSKTVARDDLDKDIMSGVGRAARDITFGQPIAAITSLLTGLGTNGGFGFRKEVQEYVAKIMTDTNPASIQEAFKAIEARAAKDEGFKALLNRAGIQLSRLSTTALGGADGDPFVPQE